MPTQITNKQVKIIDTVNFNNQSIENAIIDAQINTITGLQTSDITNLDNTINDLTNSLFEMNTEIDELSNLISDLSVSISFIDAGITKTTSRDSIVDLAQEIESKHFAVGTTLFGEIENNDMPFTGNAEVKVDILDQKDDGDQVILFTLYSTNVAPYEWEWRYYLTDIVNWIPKAIPTNDYTSNSQTTVPTSYALNNGLSNLQIQIDGISNNIIIINNNIVTLDNAIEGISTEIDSITNSILQINDILENKQNTLIAGNGIIIDNNVISSTGGAIDKDIINLTSESPITNVTLDSNNTYTLVCNNEVTTLNIHINVPENNNINNSTLLHCYIGNSNIIINYGTDTFFNNDEQPIIDSYGYYDIIWVYNNLLSKWICNLTLVNISEYSNSNNNIIYGI